MEIKVYSTTSCPFCRRLKEFFNTNGIKFEDILVDKDDEEMREMLKISEGFQGLPFTVITKADGSEEKIIGFDEARFRQILNL